jgi:hypothetical protein
VKTIKITIPDARSLEHAMDKAIEHAGYSCDSTTPGTNHQTHRIKQVTFKTLVAEVSYRDKTFTYHFEADLEEL